MAIASQKAAVPVLEPANHFELRRGRTWISFSATSLSGKPLLHFEGGGLPRDFSGDEIRVEEGELGTMVTVDLRVVVDGPIDKLTLILPLVQLADGSPERFQSPVAFHTVERSIAGLPLVPGPVQAYDVKRFDGTASLRIS